MFPRTRNNRLVVAAELYLYTRPCCACKARLNKGMQLFMCCERAGRLSKQYSVCMFNYFKISVLKFFSVYSCFTYEGSCQSWIFYVSMNNNNYIHRIPTLLEFFKLEMFMFVYIVVGKLQVFVQERLKVKIQRCRPKFLPR